MRGAPQPRHLKQVHKDIKTDQGREGIQHFPPLVQRSRRKEAVVHSDARGLAPPGAAIRVSERRVPRRTRQLESVEMLCTSRPHHQQTRLHIIPPSPTPIGIVPVTSTAIRKPPPASLHSFSEAGLATETRSPGSRRLARVLCRHCVLCSSTRWDSTPSTSSAMSRIRRRSSS
jgi:hypothetical protein